MQLDALRPNVQDCIRSAPGPVHGCRRPATERTAGGAGAFRIQSVELSRCALCAMGIVWGREGVRR